MLGIFPSSLFLLVKWITICKKPSCRKRNVHLGSKTESLGKIMIFSSRFWNHSCLCQGTRSLIEYKLHKCCLSSLHRAYKTIEEDDLKFPLIYGEGKKVGIFAFLRPKEEGILLCCLPLSLARGTPMFSTQYLFIWSFWQLERMSWFCHKSVSCLGGGGESST